MWLVMRSHRVIRANGVEKIQRFAAIDHVVFAENFQPVDIARLALEDVLVVFGTQAETEPEKGASRGLDRGRGGRHG